MASPAEVGRREAQRATWTAKETIHFAVHHERNSVGVVLAEGLMASTRLDGRILDQDRIIEVDAKNDIANAAFVTWLAYAGIAVIA